MKMSKTTLFYTLFATFLMVSYILLANKSQIEAEPKTNPPYVEGLYWDFYNTGTHFMFKTSKDNSSWSSATPVRSLNNTTGFLLWFDNGHVWYSVIVNEVAHHRGGNVNSNGTITWSRVEQS